MKKTILVLSSLLILANFAISQNRITVSAGRTLHLTNKSVSNITQSAMGQDMEIKSDATIHMDAVVKEASTTVQLSNTITRMQLKTEVMGNTIDFDSDKKEDKDGQIGQLVSTLLGKPFDILISANGTQIKNKQPQDPATEAVKSMVGSFDDLGLEMLMAIPEKMVAGGGWIDSTNDNAGNRKRFEYTVKTITGKDAVIVFTGISETKTNKSIQGMDAVVTGSSSFSGEITVDIQSGIIKQKNTVVEGKGITEVMGQSIPFNLKQSMLSKID